MSISRSIATSKPHTTSARKQGFPMPRILYMTDKLGVSKGYEFAFGKMLRASGIDRSDVKCADIYSLVETPLIRKGNEKLWKFNPEKLNDIRAAFHQRIRVIQPSLIVVSDPAVLGVIVNGDYSVASLEKTRGGVYDYFGIPVVITYPITAIHRNIDQRLVDSADGDDNEYEPYKVPQGAWILARDWEKIGRIFTGQRRELPAFRYSICRTREDLVAAERFLGQCLLISTDIETGLFPAQITCLGYTGITRSGVVHSYVIPFTDNFKESGAFWDDPDDHLFAWETAERINNNDVIKTLQNGFYDSSYYIKYGLSINNWLLDSMLLWYSMYMELPKSLDFISSILLDNYQYWKDDIKGAENEKSGTNERRESSMERYWRYNALDCYNTLFNTLRMVELLNDSEVMESNYNDVFMRSLCALSISMRGIKADFKKREEYRVKLTADWIRAETRLRYVLQDPEFNVNSPAQKVELLYTIFGLPKRNAKGRVIGKDNKKDSPSAGKIPLKFARQSHPLIKSYVDAIEATSEPLYQINNICNMKVFTDRVRTAYQAAGTESTRFSSKGSNFWDGSNLQNVRKDYRGFMVADPGCILMDIDYSQSDDVFVSYESNDPDKIKLVESGLDGHAVHGELFFKRPYDWIVAGKKANDPVIVDPIVGVRQISKKIVHGTNFQMAGFTLYVQMGRDAVVAAAILLGFSDAESYPQEKLVRICDMLMAAYRKRYKRLNKNEWYKDIADQLADTGVLANAFGVVRRFLGDAKDNGTQREATAFLGQGGTAGNMNRAMYEVMLGVLPTEFRDGPNPWMRTQPLRMDLASHGFEILLQTHDSFTVQLHLDHPRWREAAHNILHVMERPVTINGHSVSVRTESEFGHRWGKGMVEWKSKDPYDIDRIVTATRQLT
jgi:hypothetical protein